MAIYRQEKLGSRHSLLAGVIIALACLSTGWCVAAEPQFYLGLRATAPWNAAARNLGVRAAAGAAVTRLVAGGPGDRANLRVGDLIVRLGEYDVTDVEHLVAAASIYGAGATQPLEFVRGQRRLRTSFTIGRAGSDAPATIYEHPTKAFSMAVPLSWSLEPSQPATRMTLLFDRITSSEGLYYVDWWREPAPAAAASDALAGFASQQQAAAPQGVVVHTQMAGMPAVWVATYQGQMPRVALYRMAVWRAGRLFRCDLTAPALSSLDELPLPLKQILSTVHWAKESVTTTIPPVTAPQPEPVAPVMPPPLTTVPPPPLAPVPPGWAKFQCGDAGVFLPPDWQAVEGTREGEGQWQVGSGDAPDASLSLVRSQPWENFAAQIEAPQHHSTTIAGRQADVYEGRLIAGGPPARLRIVIVHGASPLDDELTWVGYARSESWDRRAAEMEKIVALHQRGGLPGTPAIPEPSRNMP